MESLIEELRRHDRQHRMAWLQWRALQQTLPDGVEPFRGGLDLTICSVAFKAKACLERGHALLHALNPGLDALPPWLLYDNNDVPVERIDPEDGRFFTVRPERRDVDMGYEHALGLAALLPHIKTRFALFLDPDCFLIRPNWVRDVLSHMQSRELGFFGTPINPRRHNSYRYFPYCVCMFVDLARVPLRDLCFVPDLWEWKTSLLYKGRRALAGIPKAGILFRWLLTEKWLTNGWRIKAKYGNGRLVHFECVQPVWDIDATFPRGTIRRLINDLTPGAVAPIPKQRGYCSATGFAANDAPDVDRWGWEEFVWLDAPFAFHVRSAHALWTSEVAGRLDGVLDAFLALHHSSVRTAGAWPASSPDSHVR